METFIYRGKVLLFDGKRRSFEFTTTRRTHARWVVMERAVKTLKLKMDNVCDIESFSVTTTPKKD